MRLGIALGIAVAAGLIAWAFWSGSPERVERSTPRAAPDRAVTRDPVDRVARDLPPVDLDAVDPARDLCGIVVRKRDGEPVAGALLTVFAEPWGAFQIAGAPANPLRETGPETRSATDGTFAIPLDVARRYSLRVEKEGFAASEWKNLRRGERVRLELEAGGDFAVRVVDPNKAPVAGARVELQFSRSTLGEGLQLEGATDETGRVAWTRVPALDWLFVQVEHPELGYHHVNRQLPFDQPLVIEYPAGRTIRGVVLDATTRRPIPGARAGLWPRLDGAVVTNENGWFEFHGWTGQPRDLICVEADGYAIGGARVGEAEQVEVTLSKGVAVIGRLVDAEGRPVESARCILSSSIRVGRDPLQQQRRCVSDADGRIAFEGVARPQSPIHPQLMLYAFADGHARLFHRFEANSRGNPHDLGELRMEAPHALTIHVDRGGEPVAGLRSWLIGPLAEGERYSNGVPQPIALLDGSGVARFEGLAPGRYRYMVRIDGAPGFTGEVVVKEREQRWDVEIAVGRKLKVIVVDDAGEPVHELLRVSASHDGASLSSRIGEDGTATLHIWPEVREILFQDLRNRDPRSYRRIPIEEGQVELRIVHSTKLPMRGVVVREDGSAVDRPRIRASRGGTWIGETEGSNKGEFLLYAKTGEPCRIEASVYAREERKFLIGSIENVAVGASDLRIVVRESKRDRKIHIRALAPDGTPLAGVSVGSINNDATTDASGIATLEEQSPRAAEMGGFDPQCRFAYPAKVVAVPDGQTIDLKFRAGSPVRVRIVDDGKPLNGVQCSVYGGEARITCRTDEEGWIRFAVLDGREEKFNLSVRQGRTQYNQLGIGAANDGETFDIRKMDHR